MRHRSISASDSAKCAHCGSARASSAEQPPKEMLARLQRLAASWGSTAGLARARLPAEVVRTVGGACRARIGIRRRRRTPSSARSRSRSSAARSSCASPRTGSSLSHFQPLIAVLREVAHAVVVITRSSGRLGEIEALGARVIDFDFRRSSSNPVREAAVGVGAGAHPRGRGCRCRASGGDEAGGAGRARAQAGAVLPCGRAHDRARLARASARAACCGSIAPAALRLMASTLRRPTLVPAGREPRRSGAAARERRRPRTAVCHPGRRRRRLRGLSGHAAARATTCRSRPSSAA